MIQKTRKIYIIPGLGETTRGKNYKELIRILKNSDFMVIPVNIFWGTNMDMNDFIKQADKIIPNDIKNDYILGFSFGAYITAILSKKKKTKGFIFCSMSPYFKDDIKNIPEESKKYFGKKMMNSFKKYSFPNKSKSSAYFLIGSKDWGIAIERMEKSYKIWKGKKEKYIVKDTEHDLSTKNYIKILKNIIKKLQVR